MKEMINEDFLKTKKTETLVSNELDQFDFSDYSKDNSDAYEDSKEVIEAGVDNPFETPLQFISLLGRK